MTRQYTPRRASLKRWLTDAPAFVLDCFDHPNDGADRYTVFMTGAYLNGDTYAGTEVQYFGTSESGHVSGWGGMKARDCAQYRYANSKHRIRWLDLPTSVRDRIVAMDAES